VKYFNEHVCVCVSVCLRAHFPNHTRGLYHLFVHVAYGRGSVLRRGDEIPREGPILGVFFPIDNALYSIAFGNHTKTSEMIKMSFGLLTWVGLRYHVLDGGPNPQGYFFGENVAAHYTVMGHCMVCCA